MIDLISDNDWKAVADALEKRKHIVLPRTLGNIRIVVETVEATEVWKVPMLVEVSLDTGRQSSHQYFKSAEEAKKHVKGWRT